jgi:uncharacterized membrane protein YgdD (TMEM256/DUF423 family)
MPNRFLAALGALYGLLGVAASAAAAHVTGGGNLGIAANFLLFHAPALLGVALGLHSGFLAPRLGRLSGGLIGLGVLLFSGDLALRALGNVVIWHMMAPTGGTLLMLGWLGVGVAALRGQHI